MGRRREALVESGYGIVDIAVYALVQAIAAGAAADLQLMSHPRTRDWFARISGRASVQDALAGRAPAVLPDPEHASGVDMLTLYHATPLANSGKVLIALHEKALAFESRFVDLHSFEQHEPWFLALNPDGQVPVLVHNGEVLMHTTVINEYLEDAFPAAPALRPSDPTAAARMRAWNKYVDDTVMQAVSIHGWQFAAAATARALPEDEFERYVARIPLTAQRAKWRQARIGFPQQDLDAARALVAESIARVDERLKRGPWILGDAFTLADINYFSYAGDTFDRLFPDVVAAPETARVLDWVERMRARPGVAAARAFVPPGNE